MKKNLLIVCFVFLCFNNASFAWCHKCCPTPCATPCSTPCATPCAAPCSTPCAVPCTAPCATPCCAPSGISNLQKACQNVVSFITIDFSFLSPRATAADVNVGPCKHFPRCCQPQDCTCPCGPQCCPCTPQCCPCAPQCPGCRQQSMAPNNDKQAEIQTSIIPVCNKQVNNKPCCVPQNKPSLFRVDLFRMFKIQIF